MYEVFDHTADIGLRVKAESLDALLVDAARGLFSLIVANLDEVQTHQQREIKVAGSEPDYLLFDWLSELLYLFDTEHLLFSDFQVDVQSDGLSAVVRGEPIDLERHQLEHEVKAITYHQLSVAEQEGTWQAEVIIDI